MGCDRGAAFDAWFARACAREPERRFETAAQQVDALADALGVPTQV
jgi:serine/threonine-protein kinase